MACRCVFVVDAVDQTDANDAASAVGGGTPFDAPYWNLADDPSTDPPAAYICNWQMSDSQHADFITELNNRTVNYSEYELSNLDPRTATPTLVSILSTEGLKAYE